MKLVIHTKFALTDEQAALTVQMLQAIQEAIAALDLPCDRKIGGNLQEALVMLEEK